MEGHCAVPRDHKENGYRLGQWVAVQRYNQDNLDSWRKAQLDQIGFVWSQRDQWWEEAFEAVPVVNSIRLASAAESDDLLRDVGSLQNDLMGCRRSVSAAGSTGS